MSLSQEWQIAAIFRTTACRSEMNQPLAGDIQVSISDAVDLLAVVDCSTLHEATELLIGEGYSIAVATEAALLAEPSWRAAA